MVRSTSSSEETASIEFLIKQFRQIESQPNFDSNRWKSLKIPIAATPATDLAGAIEKLRIVHAEMEIDADELDLNILRSAITDLETLSETT
jgi:hypothetical protein